MKTDKERLAWIEGLLVKECSMEGMWEEFKNAILPDAPGTVERSMKKAFYAGAICLFDLINFMGQQRVDQELMTKLMLSLRAEFTKFAEEQSRGAHYREDSEISGNGRPH